MANEAKITSTTNTDCVAMFRALADETRVKILYVLFDAERCVSEICEALDVEQHFASRHLRVLREAGLVSGRREAQRMVYQLHPAVYDSLASGKNMIDLGCCEVRFRDVENPKKR